ncbi:MAG TPA: STN domain-containing protein, partial [Bacteroidales bacterium]|nr:STN domain-containing protein [Bacteroidales bacterium]
MKDCFLMLSHSVFSQDLDKKITLIVRKQSLGEVIRKIGDEGKIFFSYNPQGLPLDLKITMKARNKTVREVLDLVLKKNGITYFILENQVVLKMNPKDEADKAREKS